LAAHHEEGDDGGQDRPAHRMICIQLHTSLADHHRAELVVDALAMAAERGRPGAGLNFPQ
jgi:hypothetical protein